MMSDLTAENVLAALFSDDATREDRLKRRDELTDEFMQEATDVPNGRAKYVMCRALANNTLLSEYLSEKLATEGGLKGEHLRIYTGVMSAIQRACGKLGIGVLPEKGKVSGDDNF